ncbi:MAG: hypothetical protein WCO23_00265 [bacterium]
MPNEIKIGVSLLNAMLPLTFKYHTGWGFPEMMIRSYESALENALEAGADGIQGLPLRSCDGSESSEYLLDFEGAWREESSGFWQSLGASLKERCYDPILQWLFFADQPERDQILQNWRARGISEVSDQFGAESKHIELSDWINAESIDELITQAKNSRQYDYVFDARHWFEGPRPGRKDYLPKNFYDCIGLQNDLADYMSRIVHIQPSVDMEEFLKAWPLSETGQTTSRAIQIVKKNARAGKYGDKPILVILEFNPGIRGLFDEKFMRERTRQLVAICREMVAVA